MKPVTIEKAYAGIGSRETPPEVLIQMKQLAQALEARGFVLRSGGAPGADTAFARVVLNRQIFLPWNGFQGLKITHPIPDEAYVIAAQYHPIWDKLSDAVKSLMARNVMQVLGPDLKSFSMFVICWTPDGCEDGAKTGSKTGGTGQALRVATSYGVPIINLKNNSVQDNSAILEKVAAFEQQTLKKMRGIFKDESFG